MHQVQLSDRRPAGLPRDSGFSDFTFDSARGARTFGYERVPGPVYGFRPYRPRVAMPVPIQPRLPVGRPPAWTAQWYAYCTRKYESFDRDTGLYLTFGGKQRFCR